MLHIIRIAVQEEYGGAILEAVSLFYDKVISKSVTLPQLT